MVPAVDRSFQILDLLSRSSSPLGTSEVARRLRLPKSSAHGLLRSLVAVGAVEETRQRYRLGPAVERLAATGELRRRWRPVPGGLRWVAGFAARFEAGRLREAAALLERLTCE